MAKKTKTKDTPSPAGNNRIIITAPISEKKIVTKKGIVTDRTEFYVQRSIQDYFIKFCESDILPEQLKEAWDKEEGFMKSLRLEVEIKKGDWDNCEGNDIEQESRIGEYVIIYRIL